MNIAVRKTNYQNMVCGQCRKEPADVRISIWGMSGVSERSILLCRTCNQKLMLDLNTPE